MRNSFKILAVAVTVGIGSIFGGVPAEIKAENKIQELKKEKSKVQSERSEVKTGIDDAQKEIHKLQAEQNAVEKEIKRLDLAVADTNAKIREKNKQIEDKNLEIERLNKEIKILIDRINKRNEMLKERARNYQETGGMVSYIDVLMGSQSFSDFVDRAGAVATIMEADQDLLKQHQLDKDSLETKQAKVKQDLAELQKMRTDLEGMKVKLNAQITAKNKLMATLHAKEEEMEDHKLGLEEESQILAAQEAAFEQAIKLAIKQEAERKAALEKQRREAAARAAAAAEAARKKQSSSSNGSSNNSQPESYEPVESPPVSGGMFTRPANGRYTSGYGARWGETHYGIDIANGASDVPVVSAADGVVIRSYYSGSYGNCVLIAHSIDGQIYTTVYAHLESRSVSSGDAVSKGQFIGYMGNTGQSTGKHLHFEIHKGPWNASKTNAVDPAPYLGL